MRKKAEVEKAEEGASDLLWYVRHKKWLKKSEPSTL